MYYFRRNYMPVINSIAEKIERYKKFYKSDRGGLMTVVYYPKKSCSSLDNKTLEIDPFNKIDWSNEAAVRNYAKAGVIAFKNAIHSDESMDDDNIPTIQVLAGTGMVGATFIKDPVLIQEKDTNYLQQPIKSWDHGIDRVGFDPENLYYKAQMIILKTYIEEWDGSFSILPFTHFDPLDLANQFRGNDIFYDFFEEPEKLHKLVEKSTDAILELEAYTRNNHMRGYDMEGTGMTCWLPGGSYLSCDIGDMISPEILEEFDLPYVKKIIDAWGGAYLHHHELGIHQIDQWAQCKKLTIQFLNRDPNTKHLAHVIDDKIIRSTFKVPINFISNYEEFIARCEIWAEGKFVIIVECNSEDEAKEVVRLTQNLRNFLF
jgi:hypothetical protein